LHSFASKISKIRIKKRFFECPQLFSRANAPYKSLPVEKRACARSEKAGEVLVQRSKNTSVQQSIFG